jgi:hypothetical protein
LLDKQTLIAFGKYQHMTSFTKLARSINKKTSVLYVFLLMHAYGIAQATAETVSSEPVQMADSLRSSGKIYVVVAVLLTVLSVLFIYLFRLDRNISKLEKR